MHDISLAEYEKGVGYTASERSSWFLTDQPKPAGVVLLIHGLNQKPSSWRDFIGALNNMGLHVFRLTLRGHGGLPRSDLKQVRSQMWLQNFRQGYGEMVGRFPDHPRYLVAYSLGALVGMEAQLQEGASLFARHVLLAPALKLKKYTYLSLPLSRVFSFWPSRSPRRYLANPSGTPTAAFQALFQLSMSFAEHRTFQLLNRPTLVIMKPKDELVDYGNICRFIADNGLDRWRLLPLSGFSKEFFDFSFQHLLIDEQAVGKETWDILISAMTSFLGGRGE